MIFEKHSEAFVPPNPKLFESTCESLEINMVRRKRKGRGHVVIIKRKGHPERGTIKKMDYAFLVTYNNQCDTTCDTTCDMTRDLFSRATWAT